MAEIPLLSREEEIALAKKIEITRKQFRRTLLESDYALRATVNTLHRVHSGELPFDRTIKVSLTERLTKEQVSARMPHNLRTLDVLIRQNKADFELLVRKSTSPRWMVRHRLSREACAQLTQFPNAGFLCSCRVRFAQQRVTGSGKVSKTRVE